MTETEIQIESEEAMTEDPSPATMPARRMWLAFLADLLDRPEGKEFPVLAEGEEV